VVAFVVKSHINILISSLGCLALPKLNLQFLTLHDYLLKNFHLFRLESTCKSEYNITHTDIYVVMLYIVELIGGNLIMMIFIVI